MAKVSVDADYLLVQYSRDDSLWLDGTKTPGGYKFLWMRSGVVVLPAIKPEVWECARISGDKGDSIKPCGIFDADVTYEYGNVVIYGGDS